MHAKTGIVTVREDEASSKTRLVTAVFVVLLVTAACGNERVPGGSAAPQGAGNDRGTDPVIPIQKGTMIELPDGIVKGNATGATRRFVGIPYAAPPIGELRWKAPAAVKPWNGPLDATGPGVGCAQAVGALGGIAEGTIDVTEDCLQLDVVAPEPAPAKSIPVMVWLHGGGNVVGSANEIGAVGLPPLFDGAALRGVAPHDVVVVTVNYRLGALGFLAHPALTEEQGTSGNYGLKDQQAALRWVQRNIGAFGGDPHNVTLFGESAGAGDACYHTVAKGSEGLFHRVILESGTCAGPMKTLEGGEADGQTLAAMLGCDTGDSEQVLTCLRGKPTESFLSILPDDSQAPGGGWFLPLDRQITDFAVVDGNFLSEQPIDALNAGRFARVPMIVGTNAREGAIFLQGDTAFADETQYLAALTERFGSNAQQVAERYPVARYASAQDAAVDVLTDFGFVCPTRAFARRASRHADVFVYNWTRGAEFPPFAGFGATHAVELTWVWDWWESFLVGLAGQPEEAALSHKVVGYWTSLATSGDPNGDDRPVWPRYDASKDPELVFDLEISTHEGRRNERCDFWDEIAAEEGGPAFQANP